MSITMEEAIKMALEYESKVKDVYCEAEKQVTDPTGKHVVKVLANEEQDHLDYLKSRLDEWQKTGKVTAVRLESMVPTKVIIESEVDKLKDRMQSPSSHRDSELKMLNKALEVEMETSEFYKKMVDELTEEGQKLFARFVEIEEGHLAMVQAEIDYLSGPGYWFDFREFDLAGG
ncbi:MAG: hypothetical protein JSV56_13270 [Methanomassiliicoccales archaeon]|nr:MAG: hypothetical protein JSV56_13270 [Methanomassiliicoccales archaeon]